MIVGSEIWRASLEQFRRCGKGRRECVVYWLGPAEDPSTIDEIVHPVHDASPMHYEVDSKWLTAFLFELGRRRRSVLVQVHTHGGRAFHSPTDDEYPIVQSEGFLSLVLPAFAMRPLRGDELFLARLDGVGEWREVAVGDHLDGIP